MKIETLDKKKVLLGLSGGVDSTAAALLLKEQGFTVIGLFFDVEKEKNPKSIFAEKTAKEIGIEYIYKNVNNEFEGTVIKNFCNEYKEGRTPNPCALCNPLVKFKTLIDEANRIGAYYIATGHYAGIHFNADNGCYYLKKGENAKKDQSYMLYRLNQSILSRILFPLNTIEDKEVTRNIVRNKQINNSEKKDSQEICFIKDNESYIDYIIKKGYKPRDGNFIDKDGNIIGKHKGIAKYTIGQRKGLGITFGKPMFVTEVNHNNNTVTLGSNEDLFSNNVLSKDNCFVIPKDLSEKIYEGVLISAKIRYSSKPAIAHIYFKDNGIIETVFEEKQRAITPGQAIVFYMDDLVIGGGTII